MIGQTAREITKDYERIYKEIERKNRDFGKELAATVESFKVDQKGMGSLNGTWTRMDLDGDIIYINENGTDGRAPSEFRLCKIEVIS